MVKREISFFLIYLFTFLPIEGFVSWERAVYRVPYAGREIDIQASYIQGILALHLVNDMLCNLFLCRLYQCHWTWFGC